LPTLLYCRAPILQSFDDHQKAFDNLLLGAG
jgi:hypothetical protein